MGKAGPDLFRAVSFGERYLERSPSLQKVVEQRLELSEASLVRGGEITERLDLRLGKLAVLLNQIQFALHGSFYCLAPERKLP